MSSFEKIYAENYRLIFNVVQKIIGDSDEAADIVQETFIKLFQHMKKDNIESPRNWLYRVAVNKCIDHMKQKRKNGDINLAKNINSEEPNIETSEKQIFIKQALNKLKPGERTLAVLYSEGLSYKEIAEITGIKFTSIGKTLSRILSKLGEELKKMHYEMY
ncbi:MAG: RNA polymerase sigma factor [Prolixibacteraceae bacterium]|nr:RNA polymerase sigma factor [Prolixibacteraceae bacterium]